MTDQKTVTKQHIVKSVEQKLGCSTTQAKQCVEELISEFVDAFTHGNHLTLSGFGNFVLRDKSSRPGRNPKTGEEIPISARRVVTFRAGQNLKATVNSAETDEHDQQGHQ